MPRQYVKAPSYDDSVGTRARTREPQPQPCRSHWANAAVPTASRAATATPRSSAGFIVLVECSLERLPRAEADDLSPRDSDGAAGEGIAALPGLPNRGLERAEPHQGHGVALFQRFGDGGQSSGHHFRCERLRAARVSDDTCDQLRLIHLRYLCRLWLSGSSFERELLDCLVERRILGRCRLAEIHVGLFDGHIRREPFFVNGAAAGSEVEQMRQHQAAAIRQPDELLPRRAAERALANQR